MVPDLLSGSGRFRRGNNVLVSTFTVTRETDQPAWMEPAKEPAAPSMRPSMTRLRSLAPPNPISKAGTTRVRTTWSSTALRRRARGTPRCLSQHSVGQLGFARSRQAVTSRSSPDLCTIAERSPTFIRLRPLPRHQGWAHDFVATGVHGGSWMVEAAWGEDAIHHAGKPVRE